MSSKWRQAVLCPDSIVSIPILAAIVLMALVMLSPYARTQSSNAELSGVVTDTSGAVVAGAEINALNTATNVAYAGVSNGS